MEIKINVDEKQLGAIRDFNINRLMNSFGLKQVSKEFPIKKINKDKLSNELSEILDKSTKNDISRKELMDIERVALTNLRDEVAEILNGMSRPEIVHFILDKLSVKGLGELLEE